MSDRKARLRQEIESDHAACMAILARVMPEQWDHLVPSDEGAEWKARDVLAHLAVSEGGQLGQVTRCIAGEVTVPDDFDLTRFNRRSAAKQAGRSPAEMLAEIEAGHQKVLETLDQTDESHFDKTGRHARGDVITVERFFGRITRHRRRHAEELARAVGIPAA